MISWNVRPSDSPSSSDSRVRRLLPMISLIINRPPPIMLMRDRKSTRLNSSHSQISYAVFCLKKKKLHVTSCARDAHGGIAHELAQFGRHDLRRSFFGDFRMVELDGLFAFAVRQRQPWRFGAD